METRPLYNTPEAPAIPDALTIDGQTYRRAGVVVDGVVYLADAPQTDIHSLTERILAQLKRQQAVGPAWLPTF